MKTLLGILLVATLYGAGSIIYSTLVSGISPMPTSGKIKMAILGLLEKHQPGMIGKRVYELGSGWGTLAFAVSWAFPACQVDGFERSTIPYLYSLAVNKILRRRNCRLYKKDFFQASLVDADVVVCYLCPSLMSALKEKFEKELRSGSLVVSSTFAVPGWKPVETITVEDLYRSKVYIYQM